MKILSFILLLSLSIISQTVFSQNKQFIKALGFQMEQPEGWIEMSEVEARENISKMRLEDPEFKKYILEQKGMLQLATLMKYNPKKHAGLIPAIKVHFNINPFDDFDKFVEAMENSMKEFEKVLENYKYAVEPTIVILNGQKVFYFVAEFDMTFKNKGVWKVRSKTYIVPYGGYYYQINFTGGQEEEQCTEIFEEAIKTIKFNQ